MYSQPNREFTAEDFLHQFGFVVYLPKIQGKTRKQAFLSRYLFAQCGTGRRGLGFIPGVAAFVQTKFGESIRVGQSVIDRLREREDSGGFIKIDDEAIARNERSFRQDDSVRVIDDNGFDMWDGLFQRMSGTHRAVLFVGMINSRDFPWRITAPISRIRHLDDRR